MLTILSLAYHSHISLLLISVLRSYLYNAIIHDDEDDAVDMMKGNREWNEVQQSERIAVIYYYWKIYLKTLHKQLIH